MSNTAPVGGLHHVTAIAGPAQENLDFYAGVLGMRLVKRSVNQDDPGTYHLFYADAEGRPGSDITFFPWARMAPSRAGHGLASEVALAVPEASLPYWVERLGRYGVPIGDVVDRFGQATLPLVDPHGLRLTLVASAPEAEPAVWDESPVAREYQVFGLAGARMTLRELGPSTRLIRGALGYTELGHEDGWHRWQVSADPSRASVAGRWLDLAEVPDAPRGAWGTGAIHHLAFRVEDDTHEQLVRQAAIDAGAHPTPVIDRFWFRSVYFKEPGGVLFELATDGPGFAVDEDPAHLGERLVLPPWLEAQRASIEANLPTLRMPTTSELPQERVTTP